MISRGKLFQNLVQHYHSISSYTMTTAPLSNKLGHSGKTLTHIKSFLWFKKVFVPGKPFQFSVMLAGEARTYTFEEPFMCLHASRLKVRLLAFHTNNRLGWKDLPGTNTLAY
jgi:hypothetical protein